MRDDLPSGTVTFLFTDVEGSTRLLHELGAERYAEALAEHRRVIREACSSQGGVEVDTQGDAFFFAFPTAPGAVVAAEAMTEALAPGPIQVRIGLHTGTPLRTSEGYVGDDVHFAARVASSGHGGQVVLSKATADLVELELVDLGEHRLKDIAEAVAIYQLGEANFPPLKTISNTNLPRPASSFVGRERELAEVLARIEHGARLLTLTGPGGSGKTRLALEAAASLVPEYKAGVFWVGLAALRDPALVTETIAQTLGAKDGLAEHVGERELLLLLDNLEQVVEVAPELASLLERCPNLTLLCTSRELLRVRGEVEYEVPPLAEPEAVSLFCERSELEPSDEIAELCARLDNLPLAVELAAARTNALSPAQILERLSQRLDLLKGGRDAEARHETLRATIEWSHDLLSPKEQQLFACLAVFAGGCTLEAAEEVADADLDTLQSLVEKSLLRFTNERYWMLETIREYAREQLAAAGEVSALRQHHAHHVLGLTAGVDERVQSADVAEVLAALDRESDNIRAAFAWLVDSDQGGAQLELVEHVWRFWVIRGALHEGLRWVTHALVASEGEESRRRAIALRVAAVLARMLGDLDAAQAYGVESLAMRRRLGDPEEIAHGLSLLASVAADREDYVSAQNLYEEAAALGRGGDLQTRAMLSGSLADVAMRQRDYERALTLGEESLGLFRKLARDDGAAWALFTAALCLFRMDREDEAIAPARECLELAFAIVEVESIVWALLLLGAITTRRGDVHSAATIVGAAEALCASSGLTLVGAEAELRETALEELQASLSPRIYEAALARGRKMSLENAVEYALTSID
jgi:predicted ATPase